MKNHLYPLRFHPIFKRYLWGGRRLATVLGKELGPGEDYAESWEICDHGAEQCTVATGPLAGTTLHQLVTRHGPELLGRHHPRDRFPLLFKFLDARQLLSVQVHPNDEQAARLGLSDPGKTEAWVILAAEPGSLVYAGLKPGCDRASFERELSKGTCEQSLHRLQPKAGDCIFIPAGTVHALGAGLLTAEIQQPSDTTFRLFDWNRVGADGRPRPLHVKQGLEVIDFQRGPVDPLPPQPTDRPGVERLVSCDKFVLDRRQVTAAAGVGGDDRFHILACVEGSFQIANDPAGMDVQKGEVLLLPAGLGKVDLIPAPGAILLDAYLPG